METPIEYFQLIRYIFVPSKNTRMILKNNHIEGENINFDQILNQGFSIYEVFRVYKGKLLFPGDNLDRLENSIQKAGLNPIPDTTDIPARLSYYIRLEQMEEGNIRYVLHFTENNADEYIYKIPYSYPTPDDYFQGVEVITLKATRENAEIKYINHSLRSRADEIIREKGVYEVLLTDRENYITEGSRSNLFFIRENTVYTPPLPYVLPGTARKRVLDICYRHNITVIEKRILFSSIRECEAAFITGTSPLVLPIRKIDDLPMNAAHPLLRKIMDHYFSLIDNNQ